jgi:hypothetical protein
VGSARGRPLLAGVEAIHLRLFITELATLVTIRLVRNPAPAA